LVLLFLFFLFLLDCFLADFLGCFFKCLSSFRVSLGLVPLFSLLLSLLDYEQAFGNLSIPELIDILFFVWLLGSQVVWYLPQEQRALFLVSKRHKLAVVCMLIFLESHVRDHARETQTQTRLV
jgi:hypothetical protein